MSEPDWSLPFNRTELIARCEALEAALRTIAAYRGKNAVAHQLAYIAEAALDSETPPQPDGDYTDSIDIEPSCGTSETEGELCPHGFVLAEMVCGPCSEGRPNKHEG